MKIVIQRVKSSKVFVDNKEVSSIGKGLNLLVCLEKGDDSQSIKRACEKLGSLRIFSDENSRMNLNIKQVQGHFLAISQFTLSWNGKKGNRPSFDASMQPEEARDLFAKFCESLSEHAPVKTGSFGASMEVQIINDGPVTFTLTI